MLNLIFLQKLVFQVNEVRQNGNILDMPLVLFFLISVICIFQIFLGRKKYRYIAQFIIIFIGLFYVIDMKLALAYGIEAAVNIYFLPIPKIPIGIARSIVYVLTLILIIATYKDLIKLQSDFKKDEK